MKAKILNNARKLFGEYGFHGTTTRMIANTTGIDISSLHYHWGDKVNLFEAVILDITDGTRQKLVDVESKVKGLPLAERIDIALDEMADYLFENPEISNLTLFRYFTKTREDTGIDFNVPEFISDIAFSMGLAENSNEVPVEAQMQIIAMMNSIYNFVSGENFYRSVMKIDHEEYKKHAKETLKFYYRAPFKDLE
ncbi:MAG: helix-turn-helix transcriptional regulator [Deltaproteobacteria bacterium]|nr:helix-turn-helix transcriptional regulator [Deltaproteobacteria bacterium]